MKTPSAVDQSKVELGFQRVKGSHKRKASLLINGQRALSKEIKGCVLFGLIISFVVFAFTNPALPDLKAAPCLSLWACASLVAVLIRTRNPKHLPIAIVTTLTWIYFLLPFLYKEYPQWDPRRIVPVEHLSKMVAFSAMAMIAMIAGYYIVPLKVKPIFRRGKRLNTSVLNSYSIVLCLAGAFYFSLSVVFSDAIAVFGRVFGIFENLVIFGVILALISLLRRGLSFTAGMVAVAALTGQLAVIVARTLFAKIAYWFATLTLTYFNERRRIPLGLGIVLLVISLPIFANRKEHRFSERSEFSGASRTLVEKFQDGIEIAIKDYSDWQWDETGDVLALTFSERLENVSFLGHCVALHESGKEFKYGESMVGVFFVFIPRFLYPDKPKQDQGTVMSAEYGFKDYSDTASINFPWLADLYINFGYWGMLFGSLFMGAFVRVACAYCAYGKGDLNLLVFCDLLWWLLSNENNTAMIISGMIQSMIIWRLFRYALDNYFAMNRDDRKRIA